MTLTIDAVFVDGVLKPLTPLNLNENQQVTIQVFLPELPRRQPSPKKVTLEDVWLTELGENVEEMLAEIRNQTDAMVERLTAEQMPPPETITLKGLWAHVEPDELEQALTEVREQANRRLQRLIDEI
jgi:predicted DNA-binding antitoxin AbrB/MazE fold protein